MLLPFDRAPLRHPPVLALLWICACAAPAPAPDEEPDPAPGPRATAPEPAVISSVPAGSGEAAAATAAPSSAAPSAIAASPIPRAPRPSWFDMPRLDDSVHEPLRAFIDGQPVELPVRQIVWSVGDKAWFLQIRSPGSSGNYVGPIFWFKKGQRLHKGTKLREKDGNGAAISHRKKDGTGSYSWNNSGHFDIEILGFTRGKYDPNGPFSQVTGSAKVRAVVAIDGNGKEIPDAWLWGTFDAEVVMSGGPGV